MTKLKWFILGIVLFPALVCAAQTNMITIKLVSHSGKFAFTSDNQYRNFAGNAQYEAGNPFCRELSAGYHMTEFPRLKRRLAWADLKFNGPTLFVPTSQPSRAFCNYQLVDLYAAIVLDDTSYGFILINATNDGPTEVDIFCFKPVPEEEDLWCRKKGGLYTEEPVEVDLSAVAAEAKIHMYVDMVD